MKPQFPFDVALHAIHSSARRFRGDRDVPELRTVILRYVPSIERHVDLPVSYDALRAGLVTNCNNWLAFRDDAELEEICRIAEELRARHSPPEEVPSTSMVAGWCRWTSPARCLGDRCRCRCRWNRRLGRRTRGLPR